MHSPHYITVYCYVAVSRLNDSSRPKREGGLELVENKWSRPSVKRGWDAGSSHHCKERPGSPELRWQSQGGPPSNNKAQLDASALLSLPKQWHGPPRSATNFQCAFWCHCCDKTNHRWSLPAFSQLSHAAVNTDRLPQFKGQQWRRSVWAVTRNLTLFW